MLDQLKRLVVDVVSLEDLIAAEVLAAQVKTRYEELDTEAPTWLRDKLRQIRNAIHAKMDEQRAVLARDLERQLENLKTPAERRAEIERQLKALRPHLTDVEV